MLTLYTGTQIILPSQLFPPSLAVDHRLTPRPAKMATAPKMAATTTTSRLCRRGSLSY